MRITFDKHTRKITRQGSLLRSRVEEVHIELRDDGEALELAEGETLQLILKESGKFDADPAVSVTLTSADLDPSEDLYSAVFSTITVPADALLFADDDGSNDEASALLMGTIVHVSGDYETPSQTFTVTLYNSVPRDEDVTPSEVERYAWLTENAVLFSEEQSLTTEQKAQARANIGVTGEGGVGGTAWGDITGTLASQTDLQTALDAKAAAATLSSHTSNTSNPHSVTKSQVGLGSADNTSDADKPISTATQTALDAKATSSALTSHTGNVSNPHSVTKAQVGLSSVDNTSDASKPVSTAQQTALDLKAPLTGIGLPVEIQVSCSDMSTEITAGTGKVVFRMPFAMTLYAGNAGARAGFKVAPSGSSAVFDINKDTGGGAATILSTKLSVDSGERTSLTAASTVVISTTTLEDDSEITIDFDQVGASSGGQGATITLRGTRAA